MGEWIEHDGGGCPVAQGVNVTVLYRDGRVYGPFPALTEWETGAPRTDAFSRWAWSKSNNVVRVENHIIAYRLSDTDDKAKREARMELFRGIAKSKEFLIEETLKPREKVK